MAITYLKFAYLKCVDLKLKKVFKHKKTCKQEWPWYLSKFILLQFSAF